MNQDTVVTALADGAKNCWSVISHIKSHCQRLEPILDWFDIGKSSRPKALGESFEESLESSKWNVWHGNVEEALTRLEMLSVNISDSQKRWKLQGLYDYPKSRIYQLP